MTPSQPDPDSRAQPPHAPPTPHDVAPSADDDASADLSLDRSLALVRFLRARCEWDAAQTPLSLLPYLVEEAHETAAAIAAGNDPELVGELGDLLLNIAFQIVLGEERAAFSAEDVVGGLEAKMRRRHPHLYGDGPPVDWTTLKQREQERDATDERGLLAGIADGLEPLSRAQRMQERVAQVGFDWPDAHGAFAKVVEEVDEVRELIEAPADTPVDAARVEEEIGDLLFAVVNLARLSGVHALRALVSANHKFEQRFRGLEQLAAERGLVLGEATLEELDRLWDQVKER